jgi:hypothetical protein
MLGSRGFLDEAPDSLGRAEHGPPRAISPLGLMFRNQFAACVPHQLRPRVARASLP